jgi:hypothetical protein
VRLCREGALMNFSERDLKHHRTGTRWICVVNLVLMTYLIIDLGFISKVMHDSFHFSQVLSLVFSSPSSVLPDHSSLVFSLSPATAIP